MRTFLVPVDEILQTVFDVLCGVAEFAENWGEVWSSREFEVEFEIRVDLEKPSFIAFSGSPESFFQI